MHSEVLVFLHMDDEHPGHIADFLAQKNIPYRIIRGYAGEPIPTLDDSVVGLVFMGGVMSANDDLSWLKNEIGLIKQALEQAVPLLGHCLGGQLIRRALGQTVTTNPVKEVGWHDCYRINSEQSKQWLGDIEDPFPMFHWHSETFSLPANAVPLFSSVHCKNQAYSLGGNVLAMQCHVEMTLPLITQWISSCRHDLVIENVSEQSYEQIREKLADKIPALNCVANTLYERWVSTFTSTFTA